MWQIWYLYYRQIAQVSGYDDIMSSLQWMDALDGFSESNYLQGNNLIA